MSRRPPIKFAVIGLNHDHIYGQVNTLLRAGAELATFHAPEPELAARFAAAYPQAAQAMTENEILEDSSIAVVVSAGIPCDRAPLGIRVMRHGKDYMSDKPGFTTMDQLNEAKQVQRETGRIYSICYSERLDSPATVRAGELVRAGAIGRVVQTVGLGPHRMNPPSRPKWFFERAKYGGILTDIGSHQMDQFLYFTGSTQAEILYAQTANIAHPEHPEVEDFADAAIRGDGGLGYVRVDWFTPAGLDTWGDGRLFIIGTAGYIEVRKYTDPAGKPGGNHLFLIDDKETRYVDCADVELPYGRDFLNDVANRTETAMSQTHCFLASELALRAQALAERSWTPSDISRNR